jgi:hypothetical protein
MDYLYMFGLQKQVLKVTNGTPVPWVRVHVLSNYFGHLFTRTRALFFYQNAYYLVSRFGRVRCINNGNDTTTSFNDSYFSIHNQQETALVTDVDLWRMLVVALAGAGIARSFGFRGSLETRFGLSLPIGVNPTGALSSLTDLVEQTKEFKDSPMPVGLSMTTGYLTGMGMTWIFIILSFLAISTLPEDEVPFLAIFWGCFFAVILIAIELWRSRHHVSRSITGAFTSTPVHLEDSKKIEAKVDKWDKNVTISISQKTRTIIAGVIIALTIGAGVYANLYQKDPNFKPIKIHIASQEYSNCDIGIETAGAYCSNTITGTIAGTTNPFIWQGSHQHPTSHLAPGDTVEFWVQNSVNDYSNLKDLDVRDGQPVAGGAANTAFGILIALSVLAVIFAVLA